MSYPTYNAQPLYGGGVMSGNPGTVEQDKGFGNRSSTGGKFDIDAFSSTGFDKPEHISSGVGVNQPSQIGYSNVPLAHIRTGNANTTSTSGE